MTGSRRKLQGVPPVSLRLDLLQQVLDELSAVAAGEPDPVRSNRLRGIVRRMGAALDVNRLHGVVFPAAWNKTVAKLPRPGAQSPLRAKVLAIMGKARRSEMSFKAFLRHWEQGPIDDLRLTTDVAGSGYIVTDEGEDAGHASYKLSALMKLYSVRPAR